eukprot:GFUD01037715.1.p1 GENE.GFUD01037715.1~~GFUD01037715.1.p1  ORF type:complete len:790 (-),score=138.70 GFUD01037715.1:532-2901(-)
MATRTHLVLREEDVVKLACEFMENRDMTISQISLERESGVINGDLSDDIIFLRQLILDGQWEDCLEFIQPLAQLQTFDYNLFQFLILKHKFVELLCIKSEIPIANTESAVDEVVKVLKEIEDVSPSKEEYSNLCLLLTLNKLNDHPEYKNWNPVKARCNCFKLILPLVKDLLAGEKKESVPSSLVASNDRLLQLIIKGILYESCVDYCQQKATASKNSNSIEFTNILSQSEFNDSDLSLLSWLQSLPPDTFSCPFEQRSLNVDVERIQKPLLETSWTEHMLVTPIRSNIFPHSAMPHNKPKSTDIMTKSLSLLLSKSDNTGSLLMSKSLASFHLTGKKLMDTSVDHLFKNGEDVFTAPPGQSDGENPRPVTTPDHLDKQKTRLVSEYHRQKTIHEDGVGYSNPAEQAGKSTEDDSHKRQTSEERLAHESRSTDLVKTLPTTNLAKPKFIKVTTLEDVQAVRCAEFHPGGKLYAVGSNSKTLRICQYPSVAELQEDHETYQPTVLFKRTKHHKGSIYCLAWSPSGTLIATGSNDKTVKLMNFNASTATLEGTESDLTMHDGTVRDCCFVEDGGNGSPLLLSAGAGDCKVYVTDCHTSTPFQAMTGHTGHILSLYTWGGAMFVSGSQDKTVRFWDLRTRGCVNVVSYLTDPRFGAGTPSGQAPATGIAGVGSPVASCGVDPSGRLLVTGHEDSSCILYDIRGGRSVQSFKVHTSDVRSVRFSPSAYYLLSASYDNNLVLTDLQGDLTGPLPSVVVASHADKAITGRWHPTDFSFLSSSADKTSTLWALPPI